MSTRIYFPSSGSAPPVNFALHSDWDITTGLNRLMASTVKAGTALTDVTTGTMTANGQQAIARQYAFGPLNPVTVSGTAKITIRALESAATVNAFGWLRLRVMAPDGTTVRGELLASPNGSFAEVQTTFRNLHPQSYSGGSFALSSVAVTAGDYLVIEPGFQRGIGGANGTATYNYGDTGSDLADDETSTSAGSPWIELSTDLTILAGGSRSYIIF